MASTGRAQRGPMRGVTRAPTRALARIALGAVAPLLLVACADSHPDREGSGVKPHDSTETGNPPVIDIARIALVVKRDEVHVTGEPGAVTPGGVEVEVENLASGEVERGDVAGNGSFDVAVDGSFDDTYLLRAQAQRAAPASAPVYLYRGGAMIATDGGQASSCEQRAEIIRDQLTDVVADASRACDSNDDCTQASASGCPAWICGGPAISRSDEAELAPSIAAIQEGLCQPFERDRCYLGMPQPGCVQPGPYACIAGQCTDCLNDDCTGASCETCDHAQVTWAPIGGVLGDAHMVQFCTRYSDFPIDDRPQCNNELPCVASHLDATPIWSAADLQNALAHPDVQAALAADASFGALTPAGLGTGITVGGHMIRISATGCSGTAMSPCMDAPNGVALLHQLLLNIATQQTGRCSM